jgi:hypothetical protein
MPKHVGDTRNSACTLDEVRVGELDHALVQRSTTCNQISAGLQLATEQRWPVHDCSWIAPGFYPFPAMDGEERGGSVSTFEVVLMLRG